MAVSKLRPGFKFLVAVWGPGPWYITERKGFKAMDKAQEYAEKRAEDPGVHYASIMVKDKSNREWPWRVIKRVESEGKIQAREASKREAAERREKRRR